MKLYLLMSSRSCNKQIFCKDMFYQFFINGILTEKPSAISYTKVKIVANNSDLTLPLMDWELPINEEILLFNAKVDVEKNLALRGSKIKIDREMLFNKLIEGSKIEAISNDYAILSVSCFGTKRPLKIKKPLRDFKVGLISELKAGNSESEFIYEENYTEWVVTKYLTVIY